MPTKSRFYMSRIVKIGELTTEKIISAISDPPSIQIRGNRYTFTDFQFFGPLERPLGVFARLAKYKSVGEVDVVRTELHAVGSESVVNLIDASSPFVYLPEFSGLAYKHVWNQLSQDQLERAFCALIEESQQNFFVKCELEPITDLRTFVTRLARLDRINVLQATVRPPNPLFGPCWKSLRDYLKKRDLDSVQIKEEAAAGIATNVRQIAQAIEAASSSAQQLSELMEPLLAGVGDAALLMAADGYGRARVVGVEDNRTVTIRTSDNQKSFMVASESSPEELYALAYAQFSNISAERKLEHP